MKRFLFIWIFASISSATALECALPSSWEALTPIILSRVNQQSPKMKLKLDQAGAFCQYLNHLSAPMPKLMRLKTILPKTTLELLMSVYARGVKLEEAEEMAQYLYELTELFQFEKLFAFDENTSHIIGRDWQEIDYSGEGMTWQKQQALYQPYGIVNFKSVIYLKKFFPVESKLPYFNQTYRPKNMSVFKE